MYMYAKSVFCIYFVCGYGISVHLTFCHICLVIIKCSRKLFTFKAVPKFTYVMFAFILKSVFKSYSQFWIYYLPKFFVIQASCVISYLLWQNFVQILSGEVQWHTIQDLHQIEKKLLLTRHHMIQVSIYTHEYYR